MKAMKYRMSRNETFLIRLTTRKWFPHFVIAILIMLFAYVTYVPIAISKELNQKCSKTELYIEPNDQGSLQ